MPALATLIPILLKYVLPLVVVLGIAAYFVVRYKVNQRKILEDRMRKAKEQSEQQVSQINSVQKVEQDMAQATTDRPSAEQTDKRLGDGTF